MQTKTGAKMQVLQFSHPPRQCKEYEKTCRGSLKNETFKSGCKNTKTRQKAVHDVQQNTTDKLMSLILIPFILKAYNH